MCSDRTVNYMYRLCEFINECYVNGKNCIWIRRRMSQCVSDYYYSKMVL